MNIPITIFTGFLGAGKTTLINKVVKENPQLKFGFVINEFGEEGIDGKLIESSKDGIIEMNNGCLCCVVQDDLIKAVNTLINSGKINYIIIETSGLAEPEGILRTLNSYIIKDRAHIDTVICLIDAINFKFSHETYEVTKAQIHFADIVLLNKVDRADGNKLDAFVKIIKEINQRATIIFNEADLDTKLLIDNGAWNAEIMNKVSKDDHTHEHNEIDEYVFTTDKVFNGKLLHAWLQYAFPDNIIRAKGILRLTHNVSGKEITSLFQSVGGKSKLSLFNTEDKVSRLVFIGKDINQDTLRSQLEALLLS